MKLGTFRKVIDESASFVSKIELSHRGEPVLNGNLPAMIAYASERRIATHMSTNATGLTEELALRLIQSGLYSITFSVDGLERDAYERIRVGGDFDEVVNNVMNFLKMKRRLRSRTPRTTIEVLDLADAPVDEDKGRRFLRKFSSVRPDKLLIRAPHNWAGCVQLKEGDKPATGRRRCYGGCPMIWNTMVVLSDGCVALCSQDWYNDNPLGNVHDSTLKEMWNGWTLATVRELLANREYRQIEVCSQCDLLWQGDSSGLRMAGAKEWVRDGLARLGRRSRVLCTRGFTEAF